MAGGPAEGDGLRAAGAVAMTALGLGAVALFAYLAPLSYASDAAPEQYYARARVASVECWFDPHCWAAAEGAAKDARAGYHPPPPPAPPPAPSSPDHGGSLGGGSSSKRARPSSKASGKREGGGGGSGGGGGGGSGALGCVDDDRLLSTAVGKPMSCFVVKEARMCDVLLGTPAEGACGCSCG